MRVSIRVTQGDAIATKADVLILKYAQAPYGLDSAVARILIDSGLDHSEMTPEAGGFRLHSSGGKLAAHDVIFVGVEPLQDFGYREMRSFARRALSALAGARPNARHVAATVHGPGYGLDEIEAFESQLAGFVDAVTSLDVPVALEAITVIEQNPGRAGRLQDLLHELLPSGFLGADRGTQPPEQASERLRSAGYSSETKAHVFVAMPFKDEMDDLYHYGIQSAVRAAGFVCERADLSAFTGDVMRWVRDRISTAALLIADLTDSNPNVYLEVGYAWGRGIPSVLLVRATDDLKFDVRGQRCLVYKNIRDLEQSLQSELKKLSAQGAV